MKSFFTCLNSSVFVKVTNIKAPQTQEDEFIEIQSDTGTAFQRWTVRHVTMLQQVCISLRHQAETEQRTSLRDYLKCLSVGPSFR